MENKLNIDVPNDPAIEFRPVVDADADFILSVYASTRAQEMSIVPWSEEQKQAFLKSQLLAQQGHYTSFFPNAQHSIITANDEPIGRIYADRCEKEIYILDITILPTHRNRGIGKNIIKDIIDEAAELADLLAFTLRVSIHPWRCLRGWAFPR